MGKSQGQATVLLPAQAELGTSQTGHTGLASVVSLTLNSMSIYQHLPIFSEGKK